MCTTDFTDFSAAFSKFINDLISLSSDSKIISSLAYVGVKKRF
jgi:hypothetical protein